MLDDPMVPIMPEAGNQLDLELWKLDVKEFQVKLQEFANF